VPSQNKDVRSDIEETLQECAVPGCEQTSGTAPNLRRMCLTHFIITCYGKLEELNRNTHTWSVGGTAWESARSFVQECGQIATSFSQQKATLSNLERAKLADIASWAAELGQQLRRSPRSPLAIAIRLISERPGYSWEEETYLLDVNRHGARTKCRHVIKKDDILKIIRLDSGEQVEARVVWQRETTPGAQEIGIEFHQPERR
jgi:hypothetical protein